MCINIMVLGTKTQKEIAQEINVSEKTICEWKKDEEFINEIQKQMKTYLAILSIKAIKELKHLLNSNTENIRLQTAKYILDRAGYKAIQRQLISNSNINYESNSYEEFIKNVEGDEF